MQAELFGGLGFKAEKAQETSKISRFKINVKPLHVRPNANVKKLQCLKI
jgi:hypothetical protein